NPSSLQQGALEAKDSQRPAADRSDRARSSLDRSASRSLQASRAAGAARDSCRALAAEQRPAAQRRRPRPRCLDVGRIHVDSYRTPPECESVASRWMTMTSSQLASLDPQPTLTTLVAVHCRSEVLELAPSHQRFLGGGAGEPSDQVRTGMKTSVDSRALRLSPAMGEPSMLVPQLSAWPFGRKSMTW